MIFILQTFDSTVSFSETQLSVALSRGRRTVPGCGGVGAWTEWTDWTYRDGFMDVFKKVDVSVHTSMCDGRMGRIWTYPSIKNGRNGRIKDELFA